MLPRHKCRGHAGNRMLSQGERMLEVQRMAGMTVESLETHKPADDGAIVVSVDFPANDATEFGDMLLHPPEP
jgi:hypothetical protein